MAVLNSAPVNTVPAAQNGTEDTDLVFSTANGNAITVADANDDPLTVTLSVAHGTLTLATTTGLTFSAGDGSADSTMTFAGSAAAINAALDGLVYRGNAQTRGHDTLTVATSDAAETDTDTVAILLADDGDAGDTINGSAGNDTLTGTTGNDFLYLQHGGDDTASGLAGNDSFYFGGALTAADVVDGGPGVDTLILQGDYSGGLTLNGNVTAIEGLSFLAGSDTRFGDPGTNLYDYSVTTNDANFAAGLQARIDAGALLAGEDITFDGSAETDATFLVLAGRGTDDLTGGAEDDIFFFGTGGKFAAGDVVIGGGGSDQLVLRGNYSIDFTQAGFAGAVAGVESLVLVSAGDTSFESGGGTEFDYSITWDGDLLAAGETLTVSGAGLLEEESLAFNGSDETNGKLILIGGGGNDVLTGGTGNDIITGGGRGDTLTGGAGNDTFVYTAVTESNSTERDGIQDFNLGDIIDLSAIDARTDLAGHQGFTFIGGAAFSNQAGQLRYENISLGGPIWLVQADTDGNGVSDLEIVLVISPADPITASDFNLGNSSPVNAVPGSQNGTEDTNLVFGTATGNAITVADADDDTLTTTLSVVSGTLTLATTTGLSVTGNGTSSVQLVGTAAAINAALDGLVYRGNAQTRGHDTLTVATSDAAETDTDTVAILLAGDGDAGDTINGSAGVDTFTGTRGNDQFHLQQGDNDTASGLGGDDFFYYGAEWTANDETDGGAGTDTVALAGNYPDLVLDAGSLVSVERLVLYGDAVVDGGPYDYRITTVDANVAANGMLTVIASSLAADESLVFQGQAETDGSFFIRGGAGDDLLVGGAQADTIYGGGGRDTLYGLKGNDRIEGGLGGDTLYGGGGADILRYNVVAESTSVNYDTISGFQVGVDLIDLVGVEVSTWSMTAGSGTLSTSSFDADLAAAVDALMGAGEAILFTPDAGELAGRKFVVVDANADGVYTAEADYVFEFANPFGPLPGSDFFI